MIGTLGSFLAGVWVKVLRPAMKFIDKHDEVVKSIGNIEKEITCNGGSSLKDAVINLNQTCGRSENRQKRQINLDKRTIFCHDRTNFNRC